MRVSEDEGDFCLRETDLSTLTFDEWIEAAFVRERGEDESAFEWVVCRPANPERLVALLADTCRALPELAGRLTPTQLERGIWTTFGCEANLDASLFDPAIPLSLRLDAISAIRDVFVDLVAKDRLVTDGPGLYMLWDMVAKGFWWSVRERLERERVKLPPEPKPEALPHPSDAAYRRFMAASAKWEWARVPLLNEDERAMHDAMAEALAAMLATGDEFTQGCAAHGFNHLFHPRGATLLRELHARRAATLAPGDENARRGLEWLDRCSRGAEM